MLKFMKVAVILLILMGIAGFAAYRFGISIASEKLMEAVSGELENSNQMEELKKSIESDPELKAFIQEAEMMDDSKLPIKTKEEAAKVLIEKVGIGELNEMRKEVMEGNASKEELLQEIESKLTEEELYAIKIIAYKELYSN
ncbi:hypothetical protein LLY41_02705 [Cytobacillus firmus]|uniref:hypothetical protein n=1 Tax=Cytobacillus firmus TaxID=1399 RepID=UPI0021856DA4|nr:hypothetical protein [Cytobacillus firmus]URM33412.1 hypothetical protein LLY41_02705 [Cytobacillus firmus]